MCACVAIGPDVSLDVQPPNRHLLRRQHSAGVMGRTKRISLRLHIERYFVRARCIQWSILLPSQGKGQYILIELIIGADFFNSAIQSHSNSFFFHIVFIAAPPGFQVRLDFRNSFNIELSPNCAYDHLEVSNCFSGIV